MKKIIAAILALSMTCFAFAGCGSTSDSSAASLDSSKADSSSASASSAASQADSSSESISDTLLAKYPVATGKVDVTKGATDNMIGRSVINQGDTTRLAAKLDYAKKNPKTITKIGFFGDSITAGSGAESSRNTFVNQFKDWWENNISFYDNVINAGIGATDSYIGVHRAERDLLTQKPDIIFIEFINDMDNELYEQCMDSLVRKCLSLDNNPAVIIVEPTCQDGSSPQNAHLKVAQAYNIPMISYHDAVYPEITAKNLEWTDISPDTVHPNDDGHKIMGQLLTDFTSKVLKNLDSESKDAKAFDTATKAPTGDIFANASLGTGKTTDTVKVTSLGSFKNDAEFQKFTDGWETTTGGTIKFEITAKNLGMIYMKTTDGESGSATIKVDGKDAVTLDGDFPDGWGDYAKADSVMSSDKAEKHTVEVTVENGKTFQILNWLIS